MIWAYVCMCLIYGTTFLAIRGGDETGISPFMFAGLRFFVAGLLTLLFLVLKDRSFIPRTWRIYRALVFVGLFNTTAVFALTYYVEEYVPSGYAALMAATMPFTVMLLAAVLCRQGITPIQLLGLALGFVGVWAIAWPGFRNGIPHWQVSTFLLLLASVAAAIGAIQSRKLLDADVSPLAVNGFQVLFGGVGLFAVAACFGQFSLNNVHEWGWAIGALTYLTVFGSLIASTLFFWLVKRAGALVASTWTYVSPVIAVFVGYLWYREPVYPLTVLGTVIILCGVFLLNLRAFREVYQARRGLMSQSASASVKREG